MTIFTYFHPEIGLVFIRANSRAEADAAGMRGLGSNLDYRDSGATVVSGKAAAGSRMYSARDGNLYFEGTTSGQDSPEMTSYFTGGGLNQPSGAAGGGMPGMSTPILQSEELEFGPAFRAGLRDRDIRLGPGGGVTGRLAEEFRRPILSRAFANIAFNAPTTTAEEAEEAVLPSFQEYVRTGDLFGAGAAQDARRLLEQAREFGNQFETEGSLAAQIANPATTAEATHLANIARQAARQRYGAFAKFLPSAGQFGEQYLAQPRSGALTFGDFLNQKIFGT
mgnify:CR=1 FL=1